MLKPGPFVLISLPLSSATVSRREFVVFRAIEFKVTAWASQMRRGRGRSAGKAARFALIWIEAAIGESVFAQSPL